MMTSRSIGPLSITFEPSTGLWEVETQMATSFSCPGCQRGGFHSLMEVKEHFGRQSHSAQCPVCKKVFGSDMAIIQHYQKYNKAQCVPSKISAKIQQGPDPKQPSQSTPIKSLLRTENGLVYVEKHTPKTVKRMVHSQEGPGRTDLALQSLPAALDETDANGTHFKLLIFPNMLIQSTNECEDLLWASRSLLARDQFRYTILPHRPTSARATLGHKISALKMPSTKPPSDGRIHLRARHSKEQTTPIQGVHTNLSIPRNAASRTAGSGQKTSHRNRL